MSGTDGWLASAAIRVAIASRSSSSIWVDPSGASEGVAASGTSVRHRERARPLSVARDAHEVSGEAVDLVAVIVAQLDAHRVDAVDAEARAAGFVALAQRHRDDDVAALIAGELADRTRDRCERRAELAVEGRLEERARPKSLVDHDGDLTARRCVLVEMDRGLEPAVRRDPEVLVHEMQASRACLVALTQPVGAGGAAETHDDGNDCRHRESDRPGDHSGTPAVRGRPVRGDGARPARWGRA